MLEKMTAAEAVREVIAELRARRDLAQALGAILVRARGLLGADEAYIMLVQGGRLRLLAAEGLPAGAAAGSLGLDEGIEGLAVARGELVTVPEASHQPRFRDPFARGRAVGAMAAVPLLFSGRVTGVIVVARQEPGQFGGSNVWWLDVLGALAGLAIEDDRMHRLSERRARQAEVLSQISAQGKPESALPPLAQALAVALDVPQVDLMLVDAPHDELVTYGLAQRAADDGNARPLERLPLAAGGPVVRAFSSGLPQLVNNLADDPEGARLLGEGVRSLIAVPIQTGGEARGVLYLAHDRPAAFSEDDLAFLAIVAARVGALVESQDLRQHQLQLQKMTAEAQARQEFVGIVSHELKTPVAVIQAYTDLLLRRAERGGEDANTDVVRRISEQAERMLALIEQLLDLQRLEAGLFSLEISRFDLVGLAGRVAEETQATAPQHRLNVQAEGEVIVSADRRRLEEVLQNLVDNSIKYSPAGGAVEVALKLVQGPDGGKAVVAVRDRGQGVAAEDQKHVFERFYQGGDHLHRGRAGLGLGLYISREIVRRHGGVMWLESKPGEGSTFYFSLPTSGPAEE
ncbi:MAG: GAF domain-containing sensor histidine kinase [Chloroflexi bacterium]|nr:GAF domain-containing sensor histidine kinase [Chloroflexota bacterium]